MSYVEDMIGCAAYAVPFTHLGVLVGQIMTRMTAWSLVSKWFKSSLSHWKAKILSFRGCLTLFKLA